MKKTTLAIAALSLALSSYGQRYMGVATSNWGGTNSLYLNPANVADNRAGVVVDLFSMNVLADNDLIKINTSSLSSDAGADGFVLSQAKKFNAILPYFELRLPGVMVAVKKNSFALTTRVRFVIQANNFDQRLFSMATKPTTDPSDPVSLTAQDFNFTGHGWSEIRLTYGREVYNEGDHFLKAGVTVNRLGGLGFMGIRGSIDGTFDPRDASLTANKTDLTLATSMYSSADEVAGSGIGDGLTSFFGKKTGNGWGFDLGAVYEYRPDGGGDDATNAAANKYKVRGSVAITDIGSVKYDAAFVNIKANGKITGEDLVDSLGNYSDFKSYANSRGFSLDTGVRTVKVKMPTAMVIGVDYYVASHFYVNATYFMNMVNRTANFGNSYYNQITITPRWDTKAFSIGLPIAINAMSGFKAGLGARFGGFMFGSDDIFGVLGDASGVNAYFGAYVPINKKNKSKSSAPALKPEADAAPKTN
jgi:hypothetical protein